jgi:hypothetical protein
MPTDVLGALSVDRSLLLAVLHFNLQPAAYADPERLAALWPGELDAAQWRRLLEARRLKCRLSEHLIERFGLATDSCWDFAPPRRRLALLSAAELTRIARFAGCFLNARAITKVITRSAVQELRRQIGDDAYIFAVKRATFLAPPEIADAPPPAPGVVEQEGFACLSHWLVGEPFAVAARVRLKLPLPGIPELPPPVPDVALAAQVLDKVLKEGDPAWRAYCN